jgi:hypothetical protein
MLSLLLFPELPALRAEKIKISLNKLIEELRGIYRIKFDDGKVKYSTLSKEQEEIIFDLAKRSRRFAYFYMIMRHSKS